MRLSLFAWQTACILARFRLRSLHDHLQIPDADALAGCHRFLYANPGFDHRQHRLAGNGAQPGRVAVAHAIGGYFVFLDDGDVDTGIGLAG